MSLSTSFFISDTDKDVGKIPPSTLFFYHFLGEGVFIFLVKSHFPKRFCLQRGKRNIQKMQHFQDFLHVTFSPMVAKPLWKVTFHQKDKILLSSWRS